MRTSSLIRLAAPLAPTFLAMALTACSNDSPPGPRSVVKTIGPEGGEIVVDGATVTFPRGALDAPLAITITPTDEKPPAGFTALSRIYRCEPSGTNFKEKVTMAMTFQGDGSGATMFWSSGGDTTFKDVGGTAAGSIMTAGVLHFSAGFVAKKP